LSALFLCHGQLNLSRSGLWVSHQIGNETGLSINEPSCPVGLVRTDPERNKIHYKNPGNEKGGPDPTPQFGRHLLINRKRWLEHWTVM
jgi:hypothetical protein